MKTHAIARMALVCALACGLIGCGTARRGEPLQEPLAASTPTLQNGQEAFMANCHLCHPNGMVGLAPALNDKPLPKFLIRLQVRAGLGAMPSFPADRISQDDVRDIAEYAVALRRLPAPDTNPD